MVADPCTLEHALSYLYTGEYDEGRSCFGREHTLEAIGEVGESTVLSPNVAATTQGDELPLLSESGSARSENDGLSPLPRFGDQQNPTGTGLQSHQGALVMMDKAEGEGDSSCSSHQKDDSKLPGRNARLCINAHVYRFADYYQIPGLKELAVKKFEDALEDKYENGFHEVCQLVYGRTPSSDLRSRLAHAIVSGGGRLLEDEEFMSAALGLPELLRDCFTNLTFQYQTVSEERDAALGAKLKAEDIAKEANQKGQDEKQRIVAQVNQARRCRHCSLENNVQFQREWSHLGRSEYSFRCRCRTRY